uniref:Uncharacterized protein n=1 Tax=Anguilla anguilla TaxID=7936 RepID=A0A0E9VKB9_ANGAN
MNSCCSRTPATIPTRATMPSGKSTSVGITKRSGKDEGKTQTKEEN